MNTFAQGIKETLLKRFLRYVSIDTQSDPNSTTYPSTAKQFDLLRILQAELEHLGLEATLDEYGYVMATLPATPGFEQATPIGFISHVDTTPDLTGTNVHPQIVTFTGEDIQLGQTGYKLSLKDFPDMAKVIGHTLITTDGTTLLGADDKAGVAEIITAVSYLLNHPEIEHGPIKIGFTPDEEIGAGVDHFDVEKFGAKFAYTMDGSAEGELEYENFNASAAKIHVKGRNIHPGYAKDRMINSLQVLHDIHSQLPEYMRPECTEGFEGFFHLHGIQGTVDEAEASYIIRDHDHQLFEQKKQLLEHIVRTLNAQLGQEVITLELRDQYYNMKEMIVPHPEIIELAQEAMKLSEVTPWVRPIRGGTDGARLSFMGLPCPNIFTGGMNFHGRFEYASLDVMCKSVHTIVNLAHLWRNH